MDTATMIRQLEAETGFTLSDDAVATIEQQAEAFTIVQAAQEVLTPEYWVGLGLPGWMAGMVSQNHRISVVESIPGRDRAFARMLELGWTLTNGIYNPPAPAPVAVAEMVTPVEPEPVGEVIRFADVDWRALSNSSGTGLLATANRAWLWPRTDQQAIDLLLQFGWAVIGTDNTGALGRAAMRLAPPDGFDRHTATINGATASAPARRQAAGTTPQKYRDDNGKFISKEDYEELQLEKAGGGGYKAALAGTPEERAEAINKKARELSKKYEKTHQVWILVDDEGYSSSYLSKDRYEGKGVTHVGQIIDVHNNPIGMCRGGTLASRYLADAKTRSRGNQYKRAVRLQLFGKMPGGFEVSKGLVLGILPLEDIVNFIKPVEEPMPEKPEMPTLAAIYTKIKEDNTSYRLHNSPSRDANRESEFNAWVELAGYIDRGEEIPELVVYKTWTLTRMDGLTNFIGQGDDNENWFSIVGGNLVPDQAKIVSRVKAAAAGFDDSQKEYQRKLAARQEGPFSTMSAQDIEEKARAFFAQQYPGIIVKDAGFKS